MDDAVRQTLQMDPTMASLIDAWGPIELEPADNEYERLAVSIINQQLSTASANAVRERVFDLLDSEVTPGTVLATDDAHLREAGLSSAKIEYLQHAAEAFQERDLTRDGLSGLNDEIVINKLTDIRGVGTWTANMYLIFVLGREDVLPLGDLAIRKGIQQVYGNGRELSRDEMREIAEPWRPYRSYGTRYLWREYEDGED
jgi:DNA-3-methyladenine glycosylase II